MRLILLLGCGIAVRILTIRFESRLDFLSILESLVSTPVGGRNMPTFSEDLSGLVLAGDPMQLCLDSTLPLPIRILLSRFPASARREILAKRGGNSCITNHNTQWFCAERSLGGQFKEAMQ